MLDENEKVRINPKGKQGKLQKEFFKEFLADQQEEFAETMAMMRERDPRLWLKMYIESAKLVIPKQSSLNVKHGFDKDFEKLMMLGKSTTKEPRNLEVFSEYEELKKEPELPVREQTVIDSRFNHKDIII